MSFLVSLLLPALAVALYFRSYPERVALGKAPSQLTVARAMASGAVTGASALVFLSILGVIVLSYRGRTLTPPDIPVAIFWTTQLLFAIAIGAAVGALSALALVPWVRGRLARHPE